MKLKVKLLNLKNNPSNPFLNGLCHYGQGCFESLVHNTNSHGESRIFKIREHLERLENSAAFLFNLKKLDLSGFELEERITTFLKKEKISHSYVRLLLFGNLPFHEIGKPEKELNLFIFILPLHSVFLNRSMEKQISAIVLDSPRNSWEPEIARSKICGKYFQNMVLLNRAKTLGFNEGIFLNPSMELSEFSTANIVFLKKEIFYFTSCKCAFHGLTEQWLKEYLTRTGYKIEVQSITEKDLPTFEHCLKLNTAEGIKTVFRINKTLFKKESGLIREIKQQYNLATSFK